jgi:hypothetical protein
VSVHQAIGQFDKMLGNIERWLDRAEEHATKKGFKPDVLLEARLAPDQYPLVRQIQAACDQAKAAAARLAGKEPPKHPDTEKTLPEIRARLKTVRDYLATLSAKDYEGADARVIALPFMPGKGMIAPDYLREMALPNFYFHLTHTYAILRHNGVGLGKIDFIGGLSLRDL